ncbi:hypothetical protein [Actinomadura sp. 9N215]|uniref:hypothetical protein n=1 Tax=Actinomadura sp. 9N215 TaxID=3375150 RepID=UPI0037BB8EBD
MTDMHPVDRMRAQAAAIKESASKIDVSRTESVTVADLNDNDVITELGNVTFPFPFTLSQVRRFPFGTVLHATHGWFTPRPLPNDEHVKRVITD